MITIKNERGLLLHNLAGSNFEQEQFIKTVEPIIEGFVASGLKEISYEGYAVSLSIFSKDSENHKFECSRFITERKMNYHGWTFYPSNSCRDDCYVVKGDVLVKHHLHSFLWF